MLDIYDSETITKIYRMLKKKCDAIDGFIKNHSLYYGPDTNEYNAMDVYNNIIELMARKNQLINLKVIVDNAIKPLSAEVKKVLFIKMNYNLSMDELCGILELKWRTAFRRVEHAFIELTNALNNSPYKEKLEHILQSESWIKDIRETVKGRRVAYQMRVMTV